MRQEELNKKRKEAVKLRLQGVKIEDIASATGLSAPTIITAHKMFKEGGWDAVDSQPRGRGHGQQQRLSGLQLAEFSELVLSPPPDIKGVSAADSSLWSISLLEQHLKTGTDLKVSSRTLNRYLSDLGLITENQLKLARSNPNYTTWFKEHYAAISAHAKDSGSTLLWTHYATLTTRDQPIIYTHTPRGKCCWLAGSYTDVLQHLRDFANRSMQMTDGPVTLILSGLDVFSRPVFRQQLDQMANARLYAHPIFDTSEARTISVDTPKAKAQQQRTTTPTKPENSVVSNSNAEHRGTEHGSTEHRGTEHRGTTPHETPNNSADKTGLRPDNKVAPEAIPPITPTIDTTRKSPRGKRISMSLTHLDRLEAESIHIMREVVAEADNPVMLYSIGKDSAVMLHLAMKAFYPAKPPFPLLHVDTGWKFQAMYDFRDKIVKELGLNLITHKNAEGVEQGVNPFTHGSALHTDIMKTEALRQALDKHGFDAAFGGARRDEEKSRAKERIFSFRNEQHRWDPKNQRPELWNLYNARKQKGESIRAFPLSNWTELDIWQYIHLENIPIVPLYFSAERPVVMRDGTLIMVDDDRMPMNPGEVPMMKRVRFRTLGCYPLTGAIESTAATLPEIIQEMLLANTSERQGRMIDHDSSASMEKKKQEGYF
jgi:sulfate adenylyltransferase subunit 2